MVASPPFRQMEPAQSVDIALAYIVTVPDEEWSIKEPRGVPHAPGGSERAIFNRVSDVCRPPAAVSEVIHYFITKVAYVDDDF